MTKSLPSIVVLGGINMDFICHTDRLPFPGETVVGSQFYVEPGGKGANQAVAAAKMGAFVQMVGSVGTDRFGDELVNSLEEKGVDTRSVFRVDNCDSGAALIVLNGQGENHIVAVYGANVESSEKYLEIAEEVLEGADVLMLQLEVPSAVSLEFAKIAKRLDVKVIWDPAPAVGFPDNAYAVTDVLVPNQVEAEFLTGIEVVDVNSARKAGDMLLEFGVGLVVVKLGGAGSLIVTRNESHYVPAIGIDVSDTIAAGDAFAGAMAVTLAEGKPIGIAIKYGVAAGALAVSRKGAQNAMPGRYEVDQLMTDRLVDL